MEGAIIANTLGGIGYLFISFSFFSRFGVAKRTQYILGIALSIFLTYAVYKQTFDDLWECFFLLGTLRLMLAENFRCRPALWVAVGGVGMFAYLAKAYSFPFFIFNTILCSFCVCKAWLPENRINWIKICAVSIGVMLLCSIPWILALHYKYGIWMSSTAGKLNMSWYLVGHPYWQESLGDLLPPPYPDSPYYWEEPYLANGPIPQFWHSADLFLLQIVKLGFNTLKLVKSMNEISPFMLLVWLILAMVILSRTVRAYFPEGMLTAAVSVLLFPLGFILINYEARYIWYVIPMGLTTGALILSHLHRITPNRMVISSSVIIFAASYIIWPVWDMKAIAGQGKKEAFLAAYLFKYPLGHFSFSGNEEGGRNTPRLARIAYFAGANYYHAPYKLPHGRLLEEMRKDRVQCYIMLTEDETYEFKDEAGRPFPELTKGQIEGVKVFLVNP